MSHIKLLYALLAIWAALLILGFVFGRLDDERINRIPRPNKILSSLILVMCALIWWRAGASGTCRRAPCNRGRTRSRSASPRCAPSVAPAP